MGPDAIAPDGSEVYHLVGDAERASLVEIRLAGGRVTRPVRHRSVEEIWLVTAGAGRLWRRAPGAEGSVDEMQPGDAFVIRAGSDFQFASHPGAELRFACFTSPPWPGEGEATGVPEGGLGAPTA